MLNHPSPSYVCLRGSPRSRSGDGLRRPAGPASGARNLGPPPRHHGQTLPRESSQPHVVNDDSHTHENRVSISIQGATERIHVLTGIHTTMIFCFFPQRRWNARRLHSGWIVHVHAYDHLVYTAVIWQSHACRSCDFPLCIHVVQVLQADIRLGKRTQSLFVGA